MHKKDVQIGKTYAVKVAGQLFLQPVTIVVEKPETWSRRGAGHTGKMRHNGWEGRNEKTGRTIHIKSASRLRFEVAKKPSGVWGRVYRAGNVVIVADQTETVGAAKLD